MKNEAIYAATVSKYVRYSRSPKGQERSGRYESTAKAYLRKMRYEARRRGNR